MNIQTKYILNDHMWHVAHIYIHIDAYRHTNLSNIVV